MSVYTEAALFLGWCIFIVVVEGKSVWNEAVTRRNPANLEEHTIGTVMKRNGAWLVSLDDHDGDLTPMEVFDAASSLVVAKRIVREHARSCDTYVGPFQWIKAEGREHYDLAGRFDLGAHR